MRTTIKLGRIAGVPVELHWSVFGICLLLLFGLSVQLPRGFPGHGWGL